MKSHCCEIDDTEDGTAICKECGSTGKRVLEITLKSMVKEPAFEPIENPDGFYFCGTPTCGVVYFNNEQQVYLHKEDVKVRVGIKETENPVPVCYCFGWTLERIFEQIRRLGYSTTVQEIGVKMKADECTCDIKNPSGRCCLGTVYKVVKKGMEQFIRVMAATISTINMITTAEPMTWEGCSIFSWFHIPGTINLPRPVAINPFKKPAKNPNSHR